MPLISVTRLKLRSARFLPGFFWKSHCASRQIVKAGGFLSGKLLADASRTFWTITAWKDRTSMRAFRNSGDHGRAMPKLAHWCSEATSVNWEQQGEELPDWATAHQRMQTDGRFIPVNHASEDHAQRRIRAPRIPARIERHLTRISHQ